MTVIRTPLIDTRSDPIHSLRIIVFFHTRFYYEPHSRLLRSHYVDSQNKTLAKVTCRLTLFIQQNRHNIFITFGDPPIVSTYVSQTFRSTALFHQDTTLPCYCPPFKYVSTTTTPNSGLLRSHNVDTSVL